MNLQDTITAIIKIAETTDDVRQMHKNFWEIYNTLPSGKYLLKSPEYSDYMTQKYEFCLIEVVRKYRQINEV